MTGERGYLVPEGTELDKLDGEIFDVVIVGAGIAGMTVAASLDPGLRAALVFRHPADKSATYKAQGGIAAALGTEDSLEAHVGDTLATGQGLCREDAVRAMVGEGPAAIDFLRAAGADFNREGGGLRLTREGGHSRSRIVHYYDATGRHIAQTLGAAADRPGLTPLPGWSLVDIVTGGFACRGCVVAKAGKLAVLRAKAVVIATGGYGGLFADSTNPFAGGAGIAAAYRAGAAVADMEFVQFHPTAFREKTGEIFLLTEALRGEGAILRNRAGERFMTAYHPAGDLAPRDAVARAVGAETERTGGVWLDARHLDAAYLEDRFRQVYGRLAANGLRLERELIPVAPAAHYTIGGVVTDLWGRTEVAGLFCCGEAAAAGVHGANRLASNSLLEGVVFGRRAAMAVADRVTGAAAGPLGRIGPPASPAGGLCPAGLLDRGAGVVRSAAGLKAALERLRRETAGGAGAGVEERYADAATAAELVLRAALMRRESRGTHWREDYPAREEAFAGHIIQRWGKGAVLE